MRLALLVFGLAAALTLAAAATAQQATCPLTGAELPTGLDVCPATGVAPTEPAPAASVEWSLDTDTGQFLPGDGVQLRTSTGAAAAKEGEGCLEIDLSGAPLVGENDLPAGVLIAEPPQPVHGVSFWARTPSDGRLALICAEADGSFYIAFAALPAGRWQPIVFDIRGFMLGEDDSVDENDQLDADQITMMALVDVGALPGLGSGRRIETLYIDDFKIYAEPIREAPIEVTGGLAFGAFGFSSVGWMPAGSGVFDVRSGDEVRPWVAQVNSTGASGANGLLASLAMFGAQTDWTAIQFDARSEWPCTLAVMVMEDTGGQYIQMAEPQLTNEWQTFVLNASFFEPDADKPDTYNGVLDPERVHSLIILEIESLQNDGTRGNVIEVARPTVVTAP